MQLGVHLPLIDFAGREWSLQRLTSYVDTARDLGFDALATNDHLVYPRPWLDGIVSFASVLEHTGEMALVSTVFLPVIRGPVALAKAAAALDILSGGRLVLGIGAGSSARDYIATGLPFDERWRRLDEALRVLRYQLSDGNPEFSGAFYATNGLRLEPRPPRAEGPPFWIGAWGSDAGLRRVARFGDGWLASGYNTTPERLRAGRAVLDAALVKRGRAPSDVPTALSTMWTYVTEDRSEQRSRLEALAGVLNHPAEEVAQQALIGPAAECAAKLNAYAAAGVQHVFVWPIDDETRQIERFRRDVTPLLDKPIA